MAFTSGQILTAAQLNTFDPGTKITNAGGTAGAPSYTFNGDTDTGMFRTGADAVSLATGGTARLAVGSTGNVGIGTTSPETPINIVTTNKLGSTFTGTIDGEGLRVDQSNYTADNYVSLVEASYQDDQTAPHVRMGAQFTGGGSKLVFGTTNSYGTGITNEALTIDPSGIVITGNEIQVGSGSASDPSYTFASDSDTGLYPHAADELGVAAGGAQIARFSSDGIRVVNGSAATPAYTFINDSNTGFYITGNNGRVEWSGNGTLGGYLLSTGVRAVDGSASSPSFAFKDDSDTGFYRVGSGTIYWSGNNNTGGYLWNGGVRSDSGSASTPSLAFSTDTNTGFFRQASDVVGISTGGTERVRVGSFGIRGDDSGDVYNFDAFKGNNGSASAPTFSFDSDTDSGMYRFTTNQVAISGGNNTGIIVAGGTVNTAGLSTTTLTGFQYVVRNTSFGTLYHYTSSADVKENITNVTASDASAWIDALQPVTFNERWLQEGDESDENKAWREADVQVGFIADDVLANSTTAQFAQVEDVDGTLKGVGWKWECVIAAAVAEIKSLRTRVATLEAA